MFSRHGMFIKCALFPDSGNGSRAQMAPNPSAPLLKTCEHEFMTTICPCKLDGQQHR